MEFQMEGRRYKRVGLTPETLVTMMTCNRWFHMVGCPPDAKAVGFYWDATQGVHVMFIESESFPPVADDEDIPWLPVEIIRGDTWLLQ